MSLLLILIIGQVIQYVNSQQGPQIISRSVFAGSRVKMDCEPLNPPPNVRYQWIFNDTSLIAMSTKTLLLRNVTIKDTGVYKCLTTHEDQFAEQSVHLQVVEAAKTSFIAVQENTSINISCSPIGEDPNKLLEYAWYGPSDNLLIGNQQNLIIHNIQLDQAGTYTCIPAYYDENGERFETSSSVVIDVVPVSSLLLPNTRMNTEEVIETGDVAQTCRFSDDLDGKKYSYKWYDFNDRLVSNTGDLIFRYALRDKSGTYRCVGTRPKIHDPTVYEDVETKLILSIIPLRFEIEVLKENRKIPGTSHRRISCLTPPPQILHHTTKEVFDYEWYHPNGEKLNDFSADEINISLDKREDFGIYRVGIIGRDSGFRSDLSFQILPEDNKKNPEDDKKAYAIKVWHSPQFPYEGGMLEIFCQVTTTNGFTDYTPINRIDILSEDQSKNSRLEEVAPPRDGVYTKRIKSFQASDAGQYICLFQPDGVKYYIQRFQIKMKETPTTPPAVPPKVLIEVYPREYKMGEDLVLICKTIPEYRNTEFRWIKNGREVARGSQYRISPFNEQDVGYVRCEATVPFGSFNSPDEFIGTIYFVPKLPNQMVLKDGEKFNFQCVLDASSLGIKPILVEINPANSAVILVPSQPSSSGGVSRSSVSISGYMGNNFPKQTTVKCIAGSKSISTILVRDNNGSDTNVHFSFTPEYQTVRSGENFMLRCEGPAVKITNLTPLNEFAKSGVRLSRSWDNIFNISGYGKIHEIQSAVYSSRNFNIRFRCQSAVGVKEAIVHIIDGGGGVPPSFCVPCDNFSKCIDKLYLCNSRRDCNDGIDESSHYGCSSGGKVFIQWDPPGDINVIPGQRFTATCKVIGSSSSSDIKVLVNGNPVEMLVPDFTIYRTPGSITITAETGVFSKTRLDCVHETGDDQKLVNVFAKGVYTENIYWTPTNRIKKFSGEGFTATCKMNSTDPLKRLYVMMGNTILTEPLVSTSPDGKSITLDIPNGVTKDTRFECFAIWGNKTALDIEISKPQTCYYGEKACKDGRCIKSSKFCDGTKDCYDGSDEEGCTTKDIVRWQPSEKIILDYKDSLQIYCELVNPSNTFNKLKVSLNGQDITQVALTLGLNIQESASKIVITAPPGQINASYLRLACSSNGETKYIDILIQAKPPPSNSEVRWHPRDFISVFEGDNFEIYCEALDPNFKGNIQVLLNDRPLAMDPAFTVRAEQGRIIVSPSFRTPIDPGVKNLKCIAGNDDTRAKFIAIEIMKSRPSPVEVRWYPGDRKIINEGEDFEIYCVSLDMNFRGPLQILADGRPINQFPELRVRDEGGKIIIVPSNQRPIKRNINFECSAQNGEIKYLELIVQKKPTNSDVRWYPENTITISEGQDFEIYCEAIDPYFQGSIQVLVNGRSLWSDPSFQVRNEGRRVVITSSSNSRLRPGIQNFKCWTNGSTPRNLELTITSVLIPGRCSGVQHRCNDGTCIDFTRRCNRVRDCPNDDSDESPDLCENQCRPELFTCANGKSIALSFKCDGENDCGDGSDENICANYERIPGTKCGGTHYLCSGPGDRRIPFWYQCDETPDCPDGSDEQGCTPLQITKVPSTPIEATLGQTVVLECEATGKPLPILTWRSNWGCLRDHTRMTVETVSDGISSGCRLVKSRLTIRDVRHGDDSIYNCEAIQNTYRQLSTEIKLNIIN